MSACDMRSRSSVSAERLIQLAIAGESI